MKVGEAFDNDGWPRGAGTTSWTFHGRRDNLCQFEEKPENIVKERKREMKRIAVRKGAEHVAPRSSGGYRYQSGLEVGGQTRRRQGAWRIKSREEEADGGSQEGRNGC